jgi:hypothetical protein
VVLAALLGSATARADVPAGWATQTRGGDTLASPDWGEGRAPILLVRRDVPAGQQAQVVEDMLRVVGAKKVAEATAVSSDRFEALAFDVRYRRRAGKALILMSLDQPVAAMLVAKKRDYARLPVEEILQDALPAAEPRAASARPERAEPTPAEERAVAPAEPAEPTLAFRSAPSVGDVDNDSSGNFFERKGRLGRDRTFNLVAAPLGLTGFGPLEVTGLIRMGDRFAMGPSVYYWGDILWSGVDLISAGVEGDFAILGDIMGPAVIAGGEVYFDWSRWEDSWFEDYVHNGYGITTGGFGGFQYVFDNGFNARATLGLRYSLGFSDFDGGSKWLGVNEDFQVKIGYAF